DKLTNSLDSLTAYNFNNWRISPDLSKPIEGNPASPEFDDSGWKILRIDERNTNDSCWLRKEIIFPETILGKPVQGKITFLVSVDDYGYFYVNGVNKGYFPWDGEFTLTENAKPGDKFLIAIKAINLGGPLRLLQARIDMEGTKELRESILDFSLSMQVGQKLLSFDTYQTNARVKTDPGIDKSKINKDEKTRLNELLQKLASEVDVDALGNGDIEKFRTSMESVRSQLEPIKEFAKKFTLFFDSNAHIDAAWLWREKETIQVCRNTFSSVFHMMDEKPDFTYTQSAAQYYKWMEDLYPDVYQGIKDKMKAGRWEAIGGMWIEPDCNLIDGISWSRQLLYAKRYFKNKFGADIHIGWNPDSFGYNWNMPMFYQNAGIDAFITQKIGWNDTNVFPYRVFWWESPDGSKILSYFPFDYVNTITQAFQLVDWLRQFEANTGFTNMLVLFGVGDHGGGPSIDMINRIEHLKTIDIYPTVVYGTTQKYLDWLKGQDLSDVPVWDDELYLEYHRGTYTTQANMKKYNRLSEITLTNAEKFSSLSHLLFKGNYRSNDLEEAWQGAMLNQFHDLLPGSGIREIYIDAMKTYQHTLDIGNFVGDEALNNIARNVNTSFIKKGRPVVVFNSLSWNRNDVVELKMPEGDLTNYAVYDKNSNEIPSQLINDDTYKNKIVFIAEDVPSYGYKVYYLKEKNNPSLSQNKLSSNNVIENEYFRVTVDPDSGWIKSIYDKKNGKEILAGEGNRLQMLEDKPTAWDAWNIGWTGVEFPTTFKKIELKENGPVRTVLSVYHDYLKPGVVKDFPTPNFPNTFFRQDIILYEGIDRIDFLTDVDWWEDKTMLKVEFPLTVQDTDATYEIPYGTIQRTTQRNNPWNKARFEVSAIRWADVSNNGYGVSLLNNSKYGYDVKNNVMRLSLLRSPKWPDPTADRGEHEIKYSLYPHKGDWKEANTVNMGYNFNYRLVPMFTDVHKGTLPAEYSFVKMNAPNLVLTTFKKAEDENAYIFQWYESAGKNTDAEIEFPEAPVKILKSNIMEENGEPLKVNGKKLKISTPKNSVMTLKVYF
ncbi:MAG TPA: glycoside hydrolase family 38 C-terminal domain-containing protein, partial [Ignavibacteriaceae bacterium]|nr:glycoside hydrolase family 38 C-terminal domain-containing protein [Ignavibacteriaceae bacterium]